MSDLDQNDIDLNSTRTHRQAIIEQLIKENDNKYPTDPKELKVFLQALSDMSRDALGNKRIKVDEKANNIMEQNKQIAAEILRTITPGKSVNNTAGTGRAAPIVSTDDIPKPVFVDGEIEITGSGDNYQSFTKRMGMNTD